MTNWAAFPVRNETRMEFSAKHLGLVAALGGVISMGAGGLSWIDDRYAKAPQVDVLHLRLEEKILTDRERHVQEQLWELEDQYMDLAKAPTRVHDEYRQMQVDLAQVKQEIAQVIETYRRSGYPFTESYYQYERPRRSQ